MAEEYLNSLSLSRSGSRPKLNPKGPRVRRSLTSKVGFGTSGNTGFGSTQNKPFGSTPTAPGNTLFGATTTTPSAGGFGGFGATNTNTGGGFGGTAAGGLFGAKPATGGFGAPSAASPFGGATTTTPAFGGATGGFGGSALGGATAESQGTAAVPFQATVEKEPNATGNQQVRYENICFQQPYQKFSQEELRLADYAQGRRYGTPGGQPGAFGASTGFGGFAPQAAPAFGTTGTTGTGLFGANAATTNPFGQTATTNTGFGANTGTSGGLFGSSQKPGGLFGGTTGTASGFGGAAPSTGFGTSTTTAPSLFGGAQNKPLFGAQPTTGTTGFGATTGTTGFGSTTTANPFGQTQQTTATNPFGGSTTTQQATTASPFGGGFGNTQQNTNTSLFGNAAKPATGGLFGNTATTGGGLFGNTATSTNTGFGAPAATTTTGGLFGQKPATTGTTGLFGNTQATNTAGTGTGGLFGGTSFGTTQTQQNQPTGGGLFGNLANQPAKPMFGAAQPAQTGGGLFGTTQQNTGSSLFGSTQQNIQQQQQPQQQQGTSLFGGSSLFGTPQQNQQPQQVSLTTSINDPSAFGTSMFSNLAVPDQTNPGPLATPLSSLSKQKKAGVIPLYKLNPASASRFSTPQKRGFGFTYSTYGTPNSVSSMASTPGAFGNSMLGAGLGQNKLIKSMSTSSLRNSYNTSFNREDSILAPGAFSASPSARFNSTGSMKRLVINRGIRGDLFAPPTKDPKEQQNGILKKRVSFDANSANAITNGTSASVSSPLKQVQTTENPNPTAEEMGFLRSSTRGTNGNGLRPNGISSNEPEMEQVRGNELAIVPEEDTSATALSLVNRRDKEPGEYWMSPSKEELQAMNRAQRQKVSNFTIGRHGIATVHFDVPVDLTNIDLDSIIGKIVVLEVRSATVYPETSSKPPMGQGLNVPSTIVLENSWPRDGKNVADPSRIQRHLFRHVDRLKRIPNTEFVNYDKTQGIWTFRVSHFTTYGLDYDDETDDEISQADFGQSTLSVAPDTPTPQSRTPKGNHNDQSFLSASEISGITESDPEDTFDFKKRKVFPGAFDTVGAIEEDAQMEDEDDEQDRQSFLDERSAGSLSEDDVEEPMDHDNVHYGNELVRIESNEMAGSYPQLGATAEHDYASDDQEEERMPETPGGLMRARLRAMRTAGSALKRNLEVGDEDNWAEMLQQTISPQKKDRADLKRIRDLEAEATLLGSPQKSIALPVKSRVLSEGRGFATSIDLMHSLFGEAKSSAKVAQVPEKMKGFEVCFSSIYF